MISVLESDVAVLDLLDPAFRPDGPQARAARAANWYARTPMGIAVLHHDKINLLLGDRRLVQGSHRILTAQGIVSGPVPEFMNSIILTVEGDDHTRLRSLVSRAFTPRSVAAVRPRIAAVAEELADRLAAAGRGEFMAEFADPFPARIICELLGVPTEQHDAFRTWANDLGLMFSYTARAHLDRIEESLAGLHAATEALIAARRADPRADLITGLIAAEADGDRLTTRELRLMVAALLFAGQDTTRHQLGLAMALFERHPDQWALLAERPELAADAVAEVVRLAPTATGTGRVATRDIEIDGTVIPAGTVLTMLFHAGNTDPAVFGPDADTFDITARRPAPPLSFGAGVHYCLGANLARAEMSEALPVLARRLGPLALDGEPTWRPALGITGPVALPLRFGAPGRAYQP
ncbi:cytochrome P450 [Pseudonocardia humida]|uniref:Cytochrome P450 n=1 Tax=Pseudonocardia humida TaxID=2800819 RepID=A0ABT1A1Q2_9PSEU|nr:cytochrome P450 [Pseudonocardia humida]MCO1656934.1 cytochrome P450 [Pseudonocardia humida]